MSDREKQLLLEDIQGSCKKILSYTAGMNFADFISDDKTIDAVVRNFEIIGEAANRVPEDFKSDHPEIEWRRIIGFRNRIIHEYFGINYEIVWKIKEENIPELANFIELAIEDLKNQYGQQL
jgi:uncharacterized protein with HEPN domain